MKAGHGRPLQAGQSTPPWGSCMAFIKGKVLLHLGTMAWSLSCLQWLSPPLLPELGVGVGA